MPEQKDDVKKYLFDKADLTLLDLSKLASSYKPQASRFMRDFKKLLIWQKGIEIVSDIYQISKLLPKTEQFGIISQINRAAISIPSNIAEGSSRTSSKDTARFLEIALGSLFELETQLIIVDKLELALKEKILYVIDKIKEEQKMINGYLNKLKENQ